MDIVQGTLVDPRNGVLLEGLNISLETHSLADGPEVWTGYFEPSNVSSVISGGTFRLALEDGRTQDILVEYVEALTPRATRVLFRTAGTPS